MYFHDSRETPMKLGEETTRQVMEKVALTKHWMNSYPRRIYEGKPTATSKHIFLDKFKRRI